MSSKFEKLKEELKERNDKRESSPLEDWFVKCFNQLGIYNYQREYQINTYFLDFAWPELKFAVEADGDLYHFDKKEQDNLRDEILKSQGWEIYRVNSKEAWNFRLFKHHLLHIYYKTQKQKIPSYAQIEIISNNAPDEYIKNWQKNLKKQKEDYMNNNRINYCSICDSFYSKEIYCKCK